jgi:hypothetical protein
MKAQTIRVEQTEPLTPFAQSREQFESILLQLASESTCQMTHSEVEKLVSTNGTELMRRLLQDHLSLRARQEQEQGLSGPVRGVDQVPRTHQRQTQVGMMTVFGPVQVQHVSYQMPGTDSLQPLDAMLNMPRDSYSFGVRRRVAQEAAKSSFEEVVTSIEQTTGALVPKRQAQELVVRAAVDFDAFYNSRAVVLPGLMVVNRLPSDELVVLSADGKGVVMRLAALMEATRRAAELQEHKLDKRLSKGEKKNRKRMATVAAVYTVEPHHRTSEDILSDLSPVRLVESEQERPRPQDKRVWASLIKTPEMVLREAFEEGLRRDPHKQKTWVALSDGNKQQLKLFRKLAQEYGIVLTIILDIIHVLEYLWKATTVFNQESTPAAEQWVNVRFLEILRGRSSQVAAGIRRSATKRGLSKEQRKAADKCASYLLKYRKYLHYDQYLDRGFPIATGVIEGACRYLVKDRMDITGARWGLDSAEAVLRLRALRASGDFEAYWAFHEQREYERNHVARYADGQVPQLLGLVQKPSQRRGHLTLVD